VNPMIRTTEVSEALKAAGKAIREFGKWLGISAVGEIVEWRIQINGESFFFSRYQDGSPIESYRTVDRAEAAVWSAAIIQGFQPPRHLDRSESVEGI
jgi:hypothetical protein